MSCTIATKATTMLGKQDQVDDAWLQRADEQARLCELIEALAGAEIALHEATLDLERAIEDAEREDPNCTVLMPEYDASLWP